MPTIPQSLRRQANDEAPAPRPVSGSGQPQSGVAGSEGTAAGFPPFYGQDPWAAPMGGPTAQEFVPAGVWPAQGAPLDPDETGSWTWSNGRGWYGGNDWQRGSGDSHVGNDRDDKTPTWDGRSVPLLTYCARSRFGKPTPRQIRVGVRSSF